MKKKKEQLYDSVECIECGELVKKKNTINYLGDDYCYECWNWIEEELEDKLERDEEGYGN